MTDILQIFGGIFITGLLSAIILTIFWGIIYILVMKVRDYSFRTPATKTTYNLTT